MPRQSLPIDNVIPELINKLGSAGAVVLKAEPGAGKTTRIAPAMLDAGFARLNDNRAAQIVLLQPRRVAARAAAARISEERGTELGSEIGYQVRHEQRKSRDTKILICTEGIFLRRIQDDPLLETVAAVVFDEFHERSLHSDLALAMVRQVRNEVRPDLKIVVMSATIDVAPIAAYLDNCPTVECPGRSFPIDISYLQFPSNAPVNQLAADGVKQIWSHNSGHVLVFLPGIAEIRQTQALLQESELAQSATIMPLYGDMPLEAQQSVLIPCSGRKLILATNVAETSLTIDGVSTVVDSGLARINRFDSQLGLNRLELGRISKASANQRAGRAGRTASGACLRLWTEKEQQMLADFDKAEIARVELSECVLQLIAWGEPDVYKFPWFEPPPSAAVVRAIELLDRLEALDKGALTELGQMMARLPLQPRLARLLLEGQKLGDTKRAALCAALLSERDPFRRAERASKVIHQSDSDVLDKLLALEEFGQSRMRNSPAGELLPGPAAQVLRAAEQLVRMAGESRERRIKSSNNALNKASDGNTNSDENVLRSLMSAYPDRVCKRREPNGRRALMVGGRGVKLAEDSAVVEADLFVAVEFIESGQPESIVRQASAIMKSWLPASHITNSVEVDYDPVREKIIAMRRTRFCDLVLEEASTALPPGMDAGEALAEALTKHPDLSSLVDDDAKRYLTRVQCLREWLPELGLPDFGETPWLSLLPEWCAGRTSIAELRQQSLCMAIQSRLNSQQIIAVEQEAPNSITTPNGRKVKLDYRTDSQPIMAARIQDLFGLKETPRIARGRVLVLLHMLAPNYRIQQITPDLASFWKNTYPEVKKELKGRYPKHSWPDDPLIVDRRPQQK
jgi:ATP-dependent helicase HrpB